MKTKSKVLHIKTKVTINFITLGVIKNIHPYSCIQ